MRLFRAPHYEWTTRALIDTGSPKTIFDRGAADALGVKIGCAGARTATIAILGATRTVQIEDVELSLDHDPGYCWTAPVGFITDPQFRMTFQGILGTEGFLDKWAVIFNKYYDYFSVLRVDEAYDLD